MSIFQDFSTRKINDKEIIEIEDGKFYIVQGWLECVSGLDEKDADGYEQTIWLCNKVRPMTDLPNELWFISGHRYPIIGNSNGCCFTVLNERNHEVSIMTSCDKIGEQIFMDWFDLPEFKNKPIFYVWDLEQYKDFITFRIPVGCDCQWEF